MAGLVAVREAAQAIPGGFEVLDHRRRPNSNAPMRSRSTSMPSAGHGGLKRAWRARPGGVEEHCIASESSAASMHIAATDPKEVAHGLSERLRRALS
jgi:hypothetical protein